MTEYGQSISLWWIVEKPPFNISDIAG